MAKIIRSIEFLGTSQIQQEEVASYRLSRDIFSQETIKEILNVSAPNTYLMLEKAYEAWENAIGAHSPTALPEHVNKEGETMVPTELEC